MTLSSLKRVKPTNVDQPTGAAEAAPPKPEARTTSSELDGINLPLEQEPFGTPIQRGFITEGRAERLRLQLWLADNLRQSIAPEIPLDLPLERTPERERVIAQRFQQAMQRANLRPPSEISPEQFFSNVCDEIFGFGPLELFIRSEAVSEIMVNGPYIIFAEQKGILVESGHKFLDDDHVERIIKRIVKPLGRAADAEHPLVDARLPDGSRVNAVLRPCAIDGPNITIRQFAKEKLTM